MIGIVGRKLILPAYGKDNQYVEISIVTGNPHDRYPEIPEDWNGDGAPSIDDIKVRRSCGMIYNVIDYGLGELIDQHVGHSHVASGRTIGDIFTTRGLQTEFEAKGFKSEDEFLMSKVK